MNWIRGIGYFAMITVATFGIAWAFNLNTGLRGFVGMVSLSLFIHYYPRWVAWTPAAPRDGAGEGEK